MKTVQSYRDKKINDISKKKLVQLINKLVKGLEHIQDCYDCTVFTWYDCKGGLKVLETIKKAKEIL